jgi:hypothetical protein
LGILPVSWAGHPLFSLRFPYPLPLSASHPLHRHVCIRTLENIIVNNIPTIPCRCGKRVMSLQAFRAYLATLCPSCNSPWSDTHVWVSRNPPDTVAQPTSKF